MNLYYTRAKYELILIKGDHISSVAVSGTYKVGATVEITATLSSSEGYTYSFNTWETTDNVTIVDKTKAVTEITMPASDVTITATGKRVAHTYTIKYDGNGATSGSTASSSCDAYYSNESCNIALTLIYYLVR